MPSAKTGKPMILDARPAKGVVIATAVLQHGGVDAFASRGAVAHPEEMVGIVPQALVVDVYTDHHVTCPEATSWKGKTRATA